MSANVIPRGFLFPRESLFYYCWKIDSHYPVPGVLSVPSDFYCDGQSSVAHFSHLRTETLPFLYCSWSSPLRPSLPSTPLHDRALVHLRMYKKDRMSSANNPIRTQAIQTHLTHNKTSLLKHTNGFFRIPLRHLLRLCRASALTSALYPHRC